MRAAAGYRLVVRQAFDIWVALPGYLPKLKRRPRQQNDRG